MHPTSTESGIDNEYQSMRGCIIPEVELRGMSIKQLRAVYAEIGARCVVEGWIDKDGQLLTPEKCNLYDIKDRIIMKRTESKKCSYVELIATGPQKPTRFLSHWWGESVISMIRCLEQHCIDHGLSEKTSYYWICVSTEQCNVMLNIVMNILWYSHFIIFQLQKADITNCLFILSVLFYYVLYASPLINIVLLDNHFIHRLNLMIYVRFALRIQAYAINQHKIAEEMLTNPFLKTLSICEGTVSILDAKCVVYSRLWCIFELFKSVMSGNSKFEFDVYTEIDGDKGAVGITHGFIPSDGHSNMKKDRESKFPLDRILQAANVDIKQAQASVESDRKFLLSTITGRSADDAVVDNHAKSDELNNILRGIFVTPALQRIIKEKDVHTIFRCLDIVKASNARFIDLDLRDCARFDDDILIRLADSLPPTLTRFSLWSTGSAVTVNGINASLRKIFGCPQLVSLVLSCTNIYDDGAKHIADALKINHSLKILLLIGNNIDDDGATHIADALNVNHTLETLDLSLNKIGTDGAKQFSDRLKVNHSLKTVVLYGNNIGDDGAKQIADALKVNKSLKTLHLSSNNIGDAGAKQIAEALKVNHSLEELNLSNNNINDDGAKQIADALKVNHSLKNLNLMNNKISAYCKKYLSKTLRELKSFRQDINIFL